MDKAKIERYIADFFRSGDRLSADKWRYEDGCVLLGAQQLYEAGLDERLRDIVTEYADSYVLPDGSIRTFKPKDQKLDDILPGRALLFAYDMTGEEKYLKAVNMLLECLREHPRTESGGFWHKRIYPNQIWLDGLFMAQPFRMAADTRFGKKENYQDIINQFINVRDKMFDGEKRLYCHGYDESKTVFWADRDTGKSKSFWLRAIGWYLMALADTVEEMDRHIYDFMRPLQDIYREALTGLLGYSDSESGMLWQVADMPDLEGNYTETSGSAMTAASIFKACRLGIIPEEKYIPAAERILEFIADKRLEEKSGRLVLTMTCSVAGLGPGPGRRDGTPEYYLSEPVADDDNKGAGAFFMAYAQYLKYLAFRDGDRYPGRSR